MNSHKKYNWKKLTDAMNMYYKDRENEGLRNIAFSELYEAINHLAYIIADTKFKGHRATTEVADYIAGEVWKRKRFTKLALAYSPEQSSMRTFYSKVVENIFKDWVRTAGRDLKFNGLLNKDEADYYDEFTSNLEGETEVLLDDLIDQDWWGVPSASVEEILDKKKLDDLKTLFLNSLPIKIRRVMMADPENTQAENAEIIGVSLATFKRYLDIGNEHEKLFWETILDAKKKDSNR